MIYNIMHGKIHRAVITEANLSYMGSITIDEALIELAGILPGERVQVVNNNNGARLETYVIAGKRNSGIVCLNGAAARKAAVGDIVIIIGYALMEENEAKHHVPKVVIVDEKNQPITVTDKEEPRQVAGKGTT